MYIETKRNRDFWSKSMLLKIKNKLKNPLFKVLTIFFLFFTYGFCGLSWWTSLLVIMGDLAGGGTVGLAVAVGDRWHVTCNTWHMNYFDDFFLHWFFYLHTLRDLMSLIRRILVKVFLWNFRWQSCKKLSHIWMWFAWFKKSMCNEISHLYTRQYQIYFLYSKLCS